MADKGQINYRANLSSAIFPLNSKQVGQSVISRGVDQDDIKSIPQVLYMENVLPTPFGYQSVSYVQSVAIGAGLMANVDYILRFGKVFVTPYPAGTFAPLEYTYAVVRETSLDYAVYLLETSQRLGGVPGIPYPGIDPVYIASAKVGDTAYMFDVGYLYEIYSNGNLVDLSASVTPSGFFIDKLGKTLIGSFGYLIICDYNTVYWSSLASPIDFVSSLVTGAGSTTPQGLESPIRSCHPHATGFYICSDTEIISATATGNTRYPWKFSVVKGADPSILNSAPTFFTDKDCPIDVYCSIKGQLKVISGTAAETVAPELSSLLERELGHEEFSWATKAVTYVPTNGLITISNKSYPLSVLSNRYVVVSYGTYPTASITYGRQLFKFLWVYDILLQKYGKLKIDHTHVVKDIIYNSYTNATYKLNTDTLAEYEFNAYGAYAQTQPDSIILFGKFQLERGKMVTLQEIKVSDVETRNLTIQAVPSLTGKDVGTAVDPYVISGTSRYHQSLLHETAKSWMIAIKGVFAINTLELVVTDGGSET